MEDNKKRRKEHPLSAHERPKRAQDQQLLQHDFVDLGWDDVDFRET